MAIYYLDPHTTTNGSGTWASPWSFSSSTRTGLAAGDEIRIKGVALSSLLTGTSYTATVTSQFSLTITAGGGLGADWAAGDVAYIAAYDAFFKVYSVTSNLISLYSTTYSVLPIYDWSVTSVTLQRVNVTSYPVSATAGFYYVAGATTLANITVSDCWTNATTRVTDGSVKTLVNTSYTAGSIALTVGPTSASILNTGWTINLQNTHFMGSSVASATSSGITCNITCSSTSPVYINQLFSQGQNATLMIGSSTVAFSDMTVNIVSLQTYNGLSYLSGLFSGQNCIVNITHVLTALSDSVFGNSGYPTIAGTNNTITVGYIHASSWNTAALSIFFASNLTVSVTNVIDIYISIGPPAVLKSTYFSGALNLSNCVIYFNKRASSLVAFTNLLSFYNLTGISLVHIPDVTYPSTWSFTAKYSGINGTQFSSYGFNRIPTTLPISVPDNTYATFPTVYGTTYAVNLVAVARNGATPKELLAVIGTGVTPNSITAASFPVVTTDDVVYSSTGPSLKAYLATRSSSLWFKYANAKKTIKIPCVSGTTYTVGGFVRTDDTSYLVGDVRMSIYLGNTEVVGVDIPTGCINAWQSFSLSFTASQTAEYILVWMMYYENGAKSYWLDDLTIA